MNDIHRPTKLEHDNPVTMQEYASSARIEGSLEASQPSLTTISSAEEDQTTTEMNKKLESSQPSLAALSSSSDDDTTSYDDDKQHEIKMLQQVSGQGEQKSSIAKVTQQDPDTDAPPTRRLPPRGLDRRASLRHQLTRRRSTLTITQVAFLEKLASDTDPLVWPQRRQVD